MIIPSIDVFYWSLEIADIKHFGNDYGFFDRYGKYLGETLKNQYASENDGINYFEIDKDYGASLDERGQIIKKNASSSVKLSRVNSLFAVYMLLGEDMGELTLKPPTGPKKIGL